MLGAVIKKLQNFIRVHKRKIAYRGLVLLYHRVRPYEKDRSLLSVTPERFKEHLIYLKTHYDCLSCENFAKKLKDKTLKRNSLLITFDDGYVDNFKWALPIINEVQVPVTFFIATGNIDSKNYFWWDEVEALLEDYFSKHHQLQLTQIPEHLFSVRSHSGGDQVFHQLHLLLKLMNENQRRSVLKELYALCNLEKLQTEDHRSITSNELRQMANSPFVTIGAHTVDHIVLSSDQSDVQKNQIARSKIFLEKIIGKDVDFFAYPFGAREDYNKHTKIICKEVGFKAVFANYYDIITLDVDLYEIPRCIVRDWEKNSFREKLAEFTLELVPNLWGRVKSLFGTMGFKKRAILWPEAYLDSHQLDHKYISIINTFDTNGGAAILAYRIADHLKKEFAINYFVSQKFSNEPWIKELPKRFDQNELLYRHYQEKKGLLSLGNQTFSEIFQYSHFKKSKVIHLHNLHGDYFDIRYLSSFKNQQRRIIWTLHDMEAITGHCAHSIDCDRWLQGCGECPHLDYYPSIRVDTTREYWELKTQVVEGLDIELVVPSKWLYEKIKQSFLKNKKIHLIYNGVDSEVYFPMSKTLARQKLNLPLDKKIILFSANGGVRNFYKGGAFALRLAEKFPHILFINIGGTHQHGFPNWIDIPYVDNESEMNEYYNASDALFYPSRADNCPLVLLEAKMAGLPCFGSTVGGIPELIEHNGDGILFDLNHFEKFENQFESLINDTHVMNAFSIKSRENALKRFDLLSMVSQYKELYES